MNIETHIADQIDDFNIQHEWIDIDPCFADTEQFCEKYGFQMSESANTIIIASKRGEKKYCACLVLAIDRLDVNNKVKSLMKVSRLSFAKSEETKQLTNMMIGGVSVIGLPKTVEIFIDSKVMNVPRIIIGGGSRSSKIILPPSELKKIPNVKMIDGLSISNS
ncbi:MAG: hypothetical protein CMM30_09690 [Rhodospirillaceae bacterium]|nr:hypothetical protein [Rhodospirillaceae bacterium]